MGSAVKYDIPFYSQHAEAVPGVWRERGCGIAALRYALEEGCVPVVSVAKDHTDPATFHLVVLTGFDDDGFFIHDSSKGENLHISYDDFGKKWRRLSIIFSP